MGPRVLLRRRRRAQHRGVLGYQRSGLAACAGRASAEAHCCPRRERDLQILSAWNDAEASDEIARRFGVSTSTVWDVVQRLRMQGEEAIRRPRGFVAPAKIARRAGKPKPAPKRSARNTIILQRWRRGLSASEICRDLGCSRNAVLGVVHRAREAERSAKSRAVKSEEIAA